jgi:hypothetical protein
MSGEIERIPFQEGKPPPGPGYALIQVADTNGLDDGMWWVRAKNPQGDPVQQKALEPLLPVLRWVWKHVREYISWCRSFEDWELEFARDANPGRKAALWARHTYAYLDFVHKNQNVNKAAVFGAVVSLMDGRADQIDPPSVAQKLKRLAANPPTDLENPENYTKDGRLKTKEKHLR